MCPLPSFLKACLVFLHARLLPHAPQRTQSVRGTFIDVNGKGESRVRDVHFDAVHALRFVGYVLRQAGYPCAPLYDPKNATAGIYGFFLSSRKAICGGFSKEKTKGYW